MHRLSNEFDNAVGDSLKFSMWAERVSATPLQQALALIGTPGLLSLAMGLPDPELLPNEGLSEAAEAALGRSSSGLQYSLPSGLLREQIADHMITKGVNCSPNNIFLTQGAQQAISLLARMFMDEGSEIIEEEISYVGFQCMIDGYLPRVLRVPTHPVTGIDVDAVEALLAAKHRPALIYVMPNAHNPMSSTIPLAKRIRLAEIADTYRVPIIEDDPYGDLIYEKSQIPSISAFSNDYTYYVGSFSKILGPALRVGWIVAPLAAVQKLSFIKESLDLNVSTIGQRIVSNFMASGALGQHLAELRDKYCDRRDCMHEALLAAMPVEVKWIIPSHGMFFWLSLPKEVDSFYLLEECVSRYKVAFMPSHAFSRNLVKCGARVNFSNPTFATIREGVERFGQALKAIGA